MEQILYLVLGALLAMLGGNLNQWIQNSINKRKEDNSLLFQAFCELIEYKEVKKGEKSITDYELIKIAIRIRSKHYSNLAQELFNIYYVDDLDKKKKARATIQRKILKIINKSIYRGLVKEAIKKVKNEKIKKRKKS